MAAILLVDGDLALARFLHRALVMRGHSVVHESSAVPGLKSLMDHKPDLMLLEVGLPGINGLDVVRVVRSSTRVPVIVLTAEDDDARIVGALDAGADDVVTRPVKVNCLDARIRAILRRTRSSPSNQPIRVGALTVQPSARTATLEGRQLKLTPKEFDLLLALAQRAGEVVNRRQLLASVWREAQLVDDRTLDVHLCWLRRKLGEKATSARYVRSIRGVGVSLAAP
jgi:DNA-binding response OmpR family regulator